MNRYRVSTAVAALYPLTVFERLGRFVVDFGFASLLDKFEEHYGKRAGKALVGLVGATVVVVCLGLIWGFISPLVQWLNDTSTGYSVLALVTRFAGFAFAIWMLITAGAALSTYLEARHMASQAASFLDEAADVLQESKEVLHGLKGTVARLDESGEMIAKLDLAAGRADNVSLKSKEMAETLRGS